MYRNTTTDDSDLVPGVEWAGMAQMQLLYGYSTPEAFAADGIMPRGFVGSVSVLNDNCSVRVLVMRVKSVLSRGPPLCVT
jgi:hypothetical protein